MHFGLTSPCRRSHVYGHHVTVGHHIRAHSLAKVVVCRAVAGFHDVMKFLFSIRIRNAVCPLGVPGTMLMAIGLFLHILNAHWYGRDSGGELLTMTFAENGCNKCTVFLFVPQTLIPYILAQGHFIQNRM